MKFDILIKNASIVTADGVSVGDVGVAGGKIEKIGKIAQFANSHGRGAASVSVAREIDATGLFVLPGAIDMHVHFRDPGFPEKEDFGTGSAAAAAGGVTTFIDMPNTFPPTTTLAALAEKRAAAAAKSHVNFGFYMGLSPDCANGGNLEEIKNAKNIAGVKVYMGSTTGGAVNEDTAAIEKLFGLGKFVIVHAEDEAQIRAGKEKYADATDPSVHSLARPVSAAYSAVKHILHIAKKCNARVHITHVSTALEVEELRKFKSDFVSADVTPHHLFLTDEAYTDHGNFVKVNPPLRTNKDRLALWSALREGLIQAVASDHAPHTKAEKELPYGSAPAGIPGVETLLPLLLDAVNHGEFTLSEIAEFVSANPARILGLQTKGKIAEGFDADLVIVDMGKLMKVGEEGLKTKCNWSPFAGRKLQGWPVFTIVGGKVAFEKGGVNLACRGVEARFSATSQRRQK